MATSDASKITRALRTIGVLVIVAGAIFSVAGVVTWFIVKDQLSDEKITVSEDADHFAGKPVEGPFTAEELPGVGEVGLVGPDRPAMAAALEPLGIELWSGTLDNPGLAFMGGRDGVVILSEPGRGWLPTGRPAEIWPAEVVVEGERDAEATLPGTPHRVRIRAIA